MSTEEELKKKMERLVKLRHDIEVIDQQTKKLRSDIKPLKDNIKQYAADNQKLVVNTGEAIVANKSQHHRHKSLKTGYMAIENILGPEAKIEVQNRLTALRDKLRSESKAKSILVLPIGSSRKRPGDKD